MVIVKTIIVISRVLGTGLSSNTSTTKKHRLLVKTGTFLFLKLDFRDSPAMVAVGLRKNLSSSALANNMIALI